MSVEISLAVLLVGMSILPAAGAPPLYEVEFLDRDRLEAPNAWLPSGGADGGRAFISSNGRYVLGSITDSTNFLRKVPYRWDRSDDTLEFIGDLAGAVSVRGVNDRGDVFVEREAFLGFPFREIVFWSDETGAVAYGAPSGALSRTALARTLNDEGEVLLFDDSGDEVAFLVWNPREGTRLLITITDPSVLRIEPLSLNDPGQVVGVAVLSQTPDPFILRGFLWDDGNGLTLLPDRASRDIARAINDDGTIAGETYVPGLGTFGVVWPDAGSPPIDLPCGEIQGIPQFECAAQWINGPGRVVGGGHYEDGEPLLAYVWDGTEPYAEAELFVDPTTVCAFTSVSDTGEIGGGCVQGDFPNGDYSAGPAILVPVGQDTEPPTTSDLLAVPNPSPTDTEIVLTAVIDDGASGGSVIVAAAYTIDGGGPVPMEASDGGFDSPGESVAAVLPGFAEPGVHDVCVTGQDAAGNVSNEVCTLLVIYDPGAGYVKGGGWIDSPPGAYRPDDTLTGRAGFGFLARYRPGRLVPLGNTKFYFVAADLKFDSTAYAWLVVSGGGTTAQFEGEGTINDQMAPTGDPYRLRVWARDDQPDTFRIRIWYETGGAETVVYDNGVDSPLGSGLITIPGVW